MRYLALATDFDGTLAHNARVRDHAVDAVRRLRKTGRYVILVTGRVLESLEADFAQLDLFDAIVAENGALLYVPRTRERIPLAQPPPESFVRTLRDRGVSPLEAGEVIVATWEPHETTTIDAIRDLGLELQVIFNKGAVMVLPSGVNKATGLRAALDRLLLSPHNVVGVGDAENDHAFMQLCERSAAVANALPSVKDEADIQSSGDHGIGVGELIDRLIENDLRDASGRRFAGISLGKCGKQTIEIEPYLDGTLLVAGESGGGKSKLAVGLIERFVESGYQVCILDPEGDHESYDGAVVLGDASHAPSAEEIEAVLRDPRKSVIVNLLAIEIDERRRFAAQVMPHLTKLRAQTGRPHWIVVDEAHHLLPRDSDTEALLPLDLFSMMAITVHPSLLSRTLLSTVNAAIVVGQHADRTLLEAFGPDVSLHNQLEEGQAALAKRDSGEVRLFQPLPPKQQRHRHRRKYAAGELAPEKSFYFRGASGKLNLRAPNLKTFVDLAGGVDDETWNYHLNGGDYERWFREMLGDDELAQAAASVRCASPTESRQRIVEAIKERYTAPAG